MIDSSLDWSPNGRYVIARVQDDTGSHPDGVWWLDDETFLLDRRLLGHRPMPDPVQRDLVGRDGKVVRTYTLPLVGKSGSDEGEYTMLLSW